VRAVSLVVAALLAVLVFPRWRRLRRRRALAEQVLDELPDVVEMLVVLIRSGLSPSQAVEMLAHRSSPAWRPAFAEVERRRRGGDRFADALDALPESLGVPGRSVLDALAASERFGQPLLPALERLAADGRAVRRRQHEERAHRLPVQLSIPLVVCTLPAFVLLTIVPLLGGTLSTLLPLRGPR
jgi:tight adherence protein C